MGMLRFNSCPRCKGTMALDKDEYGWYEECLQCGYLRDLKTIVAVDEQPAKKKTRKKIKRKTKRKVARAVRWGMRLL